MVMKWILIVSMGIMVASCSSRKIKSEEQVYDEAALAYCQCVLVDTTRIVNTDSCKLRMQATLNDKEEEKYFLPDTGNFYFQATMRLQKVCPNWMNILKRQAEALARSDSYRWQPAINEFAGTILLWQKLEHGEGEYELVMKSIKDSTTRTFITQAKPPKGDEPAILYVTFEPNEAAYHEKYPYRAVQLRFTNKN